MFYVKFQPFFVLLDLAKKVAQRRGNRTFLALPKREIIVKTYEIGHSVLFFLRVNHELVFLCHAYAQIVINVPTN